MAVVVQYYESEVNNEYVIRGNAAVLKCSIPSFVADFVTVMAWQDDQGQSYTPNDAYGNLDLDFLLTGGAAGKFLVLSEELMSGL